MGCDWWEGGMEKKGWASGEGFFYLVKENVRSGSGDARFCLWVGGF